MAFFQNSKKKDYPRLNYQVIWINSLLFLLIIYFIYHSLNGDRGIFAYFKLKQELSQKEKLLTQLLTDKSVLENRTRSMHPSSIDSDMLDELARKELGLIGSDEKVIILNKTPVEPKKSSD
jgi:cell division protein FtsB